MVKLLRFGPWGQERPGVLDAEGQIRDARELVDDWAGDNLDPEFLASLNIGDFSELPLVAPGVRIGACVGAVGSFVCIGKNYLQHAKEMGSEAPSEPILFMKSTGAVCGPADPIVIPRGSTHTDWEVELGVIIGRTARYVEESEALSHIAGYCTIDDVSERDFQKNRQGQWVKGKSADSFGPIGPWLVTADEIADCQNLRLTLDVNDERMQEGNTRNMIHGVAFLISYVSQFFTLRPGDVISTGTPAGVGMGQTPPRYLQPGDRVRLEVQGLGIQDHMVVASEQ